MPAVSTNHHGAPVQLDELVDGVSGRARQFVDDDALAAGQGVEQGGLTDVGTPDECHAARAARGERGGHGGLGRQNIQDNVEEVAGAAPVEGGNRVGLAQAEAPQVGRVGLLHGRIHLVGRQDDRLLLRAQHLHDALVGCRHADRCVQDEDDGVGQVDGDLRLLGDGTIQALDVDLPAAGVHEREVASGPLRGVGDAVARDARGVLDDGLAASQDSVDQRGLADVGPADDGEDRQARRDVAGVVELDVAGEQRQILLVQVELVEVGAHDAGAGRGVIVGQVDHLGRGRGQVRGVGVGRVVPGSGGRAVLGIEVIHPPSLRCGAPRGSDGDPRGAPVHRFVALTRGSARRQRGPRRRRARRCSGGGCPGSPGTTPRPCP